MIYLRPQLASSRARIRTQDSDLKPVPTATVGQGEALNSDMMVPWAAEFHFQKEPKKYKLMSAQWEMREFGPVTHSHFMDGDTDDQGGELIPLGPGHLSYSFRIFLILAGWLFQQRSCT